LPTLFWLLLWLPPSRFWILDSGPWTRPWLLCNFLVLLIFHSPKTGSPFQFFWLGLRRRLNWRLALKTEDIVWSQGSSCLPGVCPGMCEVIGAVHIFCTTYIHTLIYSHLLAFECQRSTLTFLKTWAALAVDGVGFGPGYGSGPWILLSCTYIQMYICWFGWLGWEYVSFFQRTTEKQSNATDIDSTSSLLQSMLADFGYTVRKCQPIWTRNKRPNETNCALCNCNSISLQDIGSLRLIWHIVHWLPPVNRHLPPTVRHTVYCMAKGISKVVHRLADVSFFLCLTATCQWPWWVCAAQVPLPSPPLSSTHPASTMTA